MIDLLYIKCENTGILSTRRRHLPLRHFPLVVYFHSVDCKIKLRNPTAGPYEDSGHEQSLEMLGAWCPI